MALKWQKASAGCLVIMCWDWTKSGTRARPQRTPGTACGKLKEEKGLEDREGELEKTGEGNGGEEYNWAGQSVLSEPGLT